MKRAKPARKTKKPSRGQPSREARPNGPGYPMTGGHRYVWGQETGQPIPVRMVRPKIRLQVRVLSPSAGAAFAEEYEYPLSKSDRRRSPLRVLQEICKDQQKNGNPVRPTDVLLRTFNTTLVNQNEWYETSKVIVPRVKEYRPRIYIDECDAREMTVDELYETMRDEVRRRVWNAIEMNDMAALGLLNGEQISRIFFEKEVEAFNSEDFMARPFIHARHAPRSRVASVEDLYSDVLEPTPGEEYRRVYTEVPVRQEAVPRQPRAPRSAPPEWKPRLSEAVARAQEVEAHESAPPSPSRPTDDPAELVRTPSGRPARGPLPPNVISLRDVNSTVSKAVGQALAQGLQGVSREIRDVGDVAREALIVAQDSSDAAQSAAIAAESAARSAETAARRISSPPALRPAPPLPAVRPLPPARSLRSPAPMPPRMAPPGPAEGLLPPSPPPAVGTGRRRATPQRATPQRRVVELEPASAARVMPPTPVPPVPPVPSQSLMSPPDFQGGVVRRRVGEVAPEVSKRETTPPAPAAPPENEEEMEVLGEEMEVLGEGLPRAWKRQGFGPGQRVRLAKIPEGVFEEIAETLIETPDVTAIDRGGVGRAFVRELVQRGHLPNPEVLVAQEQETRRLAAQVDRVAQVDEVRAGLPENKKARKEEIDHLLEQLRQAEDEQLLLQQMEEQERDLRWLSVTTKLDEWLNTHAMIVREIIAVSRREADYKAHGGGQPLASEEFVPLPPDLARLVDELAQRIASIPEEELFETAISALDAAAMDPFTAEHVVATYYAVHDCMTLLGELENDPIVIDARKLLDQSIHAYLEEIAKREDTLQRTAYSADRAVELADSVLALSGYLLRRAGEYLDPQGLVRGLRGTRGRGLGYVAPETQRYFMYTHRVGSHPGLRPNRRSRSRSRRRYNSRPRWGRVASGILFISDGEMLLTLRSSEVMDPGVWGLPGGRVDGMGVYDNDSHRDQEWAYTSAWKEVGEELGDEATALLESEARLVEHFVYREESFTFITYVVEVPPYLKDDVLGCVELNWENDNVTWSSLEEPIEPLHDGVQWLFSQFDVA